MSPPTIGQSFSIGDPTSPSHSARVEWLLNQIRLLSAAGSGPDYTQLLTAILASNQQGNSSDLQLINRLDQVINSDTLQNALFNAILASSDAIKLEQPGQSAALQQLVVLMSLVSGEISSIISPDISSISSQFGGIFGYLQQILDETSLVKAELIKANTPLGPTFRDVYDIGQLTGGTITVLMPGNCREIIITNCVGDRSGNPKFNAWIYGSYWTAIQGQPPRPDSSLYDFSVAPGNTLSLPWISGTQFDLAAEGGGAESGSIVITTFGHI